MTNELEQRILSALKINGNGAYFFGAEDYNHVKVRQGKALFISHVFDSVAAGATVYLRHRGATTKYLSSILKINTAGDWTIKTYSGATYSNNGTVLAPINRKSDSAETLQTIFTHTPTVTTLGTERLKERFGYGTNPILTSTSGFTEQLESIFAPGTDVLIELKNNNVSGTFYLSAKFEVYEL